MQFANWSCFPRTFSLPASLEVCSCETRSFHFSHLPLTSRGPHRTGTARKQDVKKQRVPHLRRKPASGHPLERHRGSVLQVRQDHLHRPEEPKRTAIFVRRVRGSKVGDGRAFWRPLKRVSLKRSASPNAID